MILRNFKGREQLDVSGLNKITVLLDRSESELTEIGLNEWRPKLNGPPHKHLEKDQVFYIHSGVGVVKLGNDQYNVTQGDVIYVPAGLMHQTITTEEGTLRYVLFNVFNDAFREGHTTFADHIEKVKQTRKEQAEKGTADIKEYDSGDIANNPKFIQDLSTGNKHNSKTYESYVLLDSDETNRFTLSALQIPAKSKEVLMADNDKEKSFFVIEGEGNIAIKKEENKIQSDDLFYVPRGVSLAIETAQANATLLCLKVSL